MDDTVKNISERVYLEWIVSGGKKAAGRMDLGRIARGRNSLICFYQSQVLPTDYIRNYLTGTSHFGYLKPCGL